MADEYTGSTSDSGGGGTAVLDSSPESPASSSDLSTSVGTTSDQGSGDASPTPSEPSIPKSRFDQLNTRLQQWQWAEENRVNPSELRQLTEWIDRDPAGFHRYLTNVLTQRGVLNQPQAPQQPQQPQSNPTELPGPDYQYRDEQGNVTKFYSADQMQRLAQALEARFSQQLAPVNQFVSAQQMQWAAKTEGDSILANARANWPGFTDHEGEMLTLMQQAAARGRTLNLQDAYIQVVPKALSDRTRQQTIVDLQQKPDATTTSPARTQPQGGEDLSKLSIPQLFQREMRKRGMGR